MFGFGGIGLKIAIAAILFSIVSGGYFYIQSLRSELKVAAEVQGKMQDVITSQTQAMNTIKQDIERMNEAQKEISSKVQEAQKTSDDLAKKFTQDSQGRERNLTREALARPQVMEEKINQGSKNALRCNEIITGSQLTADEKSGKVKNPICPNLFPKTETNK